VVEALLSLPDDRFVLDGELVVSGGSGFDFSALMLRLHPSRSRVDRLRVETPASLIAFDILAEGTADLRTRSLAERRARLEALLGGAPPGVSVTPDTDDAGVAARWLAHLQGGGVDGVMAKEVSSVYEPGRRSRHWLKVKHERTADCVVGGFRWLEGRRSAAGEPLVASLLLGLYDAGGALRHVGIAASFRTPRRAQLAQELRPYVTTLEGHPWQYGFALERGPSGRLKGAGGAWDPATMAQDWVPVRPELVCEIAYDQVDASGRWRHPGRFRRWRPDRDAPSCSFDQLVVAVPDPFEILGLPRRAREVG
jgi:ATP-dependent DNA ligase